MLLNPRNNERILAIQEYLENIKQANETNDIKKLEKNAELLSMAIYKLLIGVYNIQKIKNLKK